MLDGFLGEELCKWITLKVKSGEWQGHLLNQIHYKTTVTAALRRAQEQSQELRNRGAGCL